MATQNRTSTQHRSSAGRSRSSGRQGGGAMWFELDCSSVTSRLRGITASWLRNNHEARKKMLHWGLVAKKESITAVRSKVLIDPRSAWKAVTFGMSWSNPSQAILYLNITDNNTAFTRTWVPYRHPVTRNKRGDTRGGNRRKQNDRTKQVNAYWGRSRAFVLRFVNSGTEERKNNQTGRWNRGAKSYRTKTINSGMKTPNRGKIKRRNFFFGPSRIALLRVAVSCIEDLQKIIIKEIDR